MSDRLVIDGQKQTNPAPMPPLRLLPVSGIFVPEPEVLELTGEVAWRAYENFVDTEPMGLRP